MRTANAAACIALLTLLVPSPLQAGQIRSVGFEELTERAGRIFAGRCVASEVVRDASLGFDVAQVTFVVERAIKGELGRTVTVRIFGVDAPRFATGEQVVLFLYADSALGLTSPVGFGQGKFSVLRDKAGRDVAVNAFGNENLLRDLSGGARERMRTVLGSWDGKAALSPQALLDGARDLLAARGR